MTFKLDRNPFAEIPEPPAPESSRVLTVKKENREVLPAKPKLEHLHSFSDLQEFLDKARRDRRLMPEERARLGEACDSLVGCDPWKYEPFLMDELFRELRGEADPERIRELRGEADPERIRELRGFIRAGSWMTYPRQTPADVLGHLSAVRQAELEDWNWRLRNADPDTAKEIKDNRDEQARDFGLTEKAVAQGFCGEDLETATRIVEDLLGHSWYELKAAMAAHGLDWRAAEKHPATAKLFREISELRPVRDYLYHRRLYPEWAKFTQE
jgi:hypothetical protein